MSPTLSNVDVYSLFGASSGRRDPVIRRDGPARDSDLRNRGLRSGWRLADLSDTHRQLSTVLTELVPTARRVRNSTSPTASGGSRTSGGTVQYLMLDGALRRTISNGVNKAAHAAFVTIGDPSAANALTYRARAAGAQGKTISVTYALAQQVRR